SLRHRHLTAKCEEYDVCRCVIEESGESTGRPEVLPWLIHAFANRTTVCLESFQRHLHRDEDTDEERRDFCNGCVVELVKLSYSARCQSQRKSDQHQHDDFPQQRERRPIGQWKWLLVVDKGHGKDHAGKKENVYDPLHP